MGIRTTKIALVAAALVAMLALTACTTTNVTATSGPPRDTVTAVGTGTGKAAPDTAELSFGVTVSGKTNTAAMDAAGKAGNKIVEALKAGGLDATEIRTDRINLFPMTDAKGATTGYQANVTVRVKTKKIDKVGELTSAATAAGATDISGPDFALADANTARLDAIDKAMADAKARAAAMAKAAGRTLGEVVSVTESGVSQPGPMFDSVAAAKGGGVTAPPIEPGQVESQIQLTVVFGLK
ncbi:MAG: SIMPL domain-containing protein [Coriobacteriia bacterium]|nr:SIMPL domain-containing protein [Coriobacteriia bacterium]